MKILDNMGVSKVSGNFHPGNEPILQILQVAMVGYPWIEFVCPAHPGEMMLKIQLLHHKNKLHLKKCI